METRRAIHARREGLLSRIHELEDELTHLRREYNSLLPISILPPEIFAHIFSYHSIRMQIHINQRDKPLSTCTVFAISKVCRRWRDIALNTPHLWNRILLTNQHVTKMLLERSAAVPLSIRAKIVQPEDPIVKILDTSAAPRVREFAVESNVMAISGKYDVGELLSRVPNISALTLSSATIYWPTLSTFFHLEHLNIAFCEPRLTVDAFMDVLSQIQHLRTLSTEATFDFDPHLHTYSRPLVHLPNLECLALSEPSFRCCELICNLEFPIDASLVVIWSLYSPSEFTTCLRPLLTHHFVRDSTCDTHSPDFRLERLYIRGHDIQSVSYQIVVPLPSRQGDKLTSRPYFGEPSSVQFCFSGTSMIPEDLASDFQELFAWLLTIPCFASVDSVTLSSPWHNNPIHLSCLWNGWSNVTEVVLKETVFPEFCHKELVSIPDDDDDDGEDQDQDEGGDDVEEEGNEVRNDDESSFEGSPLEPLGEYKSPLTDQLARMMLKPFNALPRLESLVLEETNVAGAFLLLNAQLVLHRQRMGVQTSSDLLDSLPGGKWIGVKIRKCKVSEDQARALWEAGGCVGEWDEVWDGI